KAAFHYEIIEDGDVWMEILQSRNLMAHTYDEKRFNIAINKIKDEYFIAIKQLVEFLEERK
ncbi:nucleotidyltransferase, partial [Coprococcus sp. MSK.21.13]|nr:nucleotidyltransferase [Coprococcus sp. MSK.21.13]